MNKFFLNLILIGFVAHSALAGEAKVQWLNAENYSDTRSTTESTRDYQERIAKKLNEIFDELAKKLPDGYRWSVNVTDIDLAGDIVRNPRSYFYEQRLIKDIYPPRISFNYTLNNSKNEIVHTASENLIDMGFLMSSTNNRRDEEFYYEARLLRDWFARQQKAGVLPTR